MLGVKELLPTAESQAEAGKLAALKVGIKKGGCAGMEYTLEFVESVNDSDEIIEKELSLSGVQRPITEDQLAGDFINWFKFGDFSGYLIEKPA